MADGKVEITDISKLAPDLLNKSVAQLEREITERQMALEQIRKAEEEKRRAKVLEEVGSRMDRVVEDLRWLNDNGFLGENVKEAFMSKGRGEEKVFAPHLRFRRPTK